MEGMDVNFWQGRRVLVTGHTGFKGAWLSLWMLEAGAKVSGLALEPETKPALFDQLGLADAMDHRIFDIRDAAGLHEAVKEIKPDIVMHLAAQPLVLRSYREQVSTWNVNVMGTIHVLEALRSLEKVCAAVIITTDKVYENRECEYGYRETDPLGGYDPYSASKAAAEIAVSCWRRSFFTDKTGVRIASARAGNVIGGGDWSENRILPDIIRALHEGKQIQVRNRHAIRPWQHVLEPLDGYLSLARRLFESSESCYQDAFNFGPSGTANRPVGELVAECLKHWPGRVTDLSPPDAPHEAGRLGLTIDRAEVRLDWRPKYTFSRSVAETMAWYKMQTKLNIAELRRFTIGQIQGYQSETSKCN